MLAQILPLELSPRRLMFFLSEECSRLGKKGLAWARPHRAPCSFVAPSPWRDGICLSERIPLAWASPVSLGEAAGRFWCCCWMVHWCVASLSDPNALLEGLCDDGMSNMLHLKWKWHVVWLGMNWKAWVVWIVVYTWYLCYGKLLIGWWNMFTVWVWH